MPYDEEAPLLYSLGVARWDRLPDGNVSLSFVAPVPGSGDNAQTINLRTNCRIVMSPATVGQMVAFLAPHFPAPEPADGQPTKQ